MLYFVGVKPNAPRDVVRVSESSCRWKYERSVNELIKMLNMVGRKSHIYTEFGVPSPSTKAAEPIRRAANCH